MAVGNVGLALDACVASQMDSSSDESSIIRFLADSGLDNFLLINPPVNLDEAGRRVGVTNVRYVDLPFDGLLRPSSAGATIMLNSNDSRARQRFSWAHEIAHALLDPNNPAGRNFPGSVGSIEAQCDRIASVLLMPNPTFRDYLLTYGLSINSIPKLADIFFTSIQATAMRYVTVMGQLTKPCVLIVSRFGQRNSGLKLRVQWSYQNTRTLDGRDMYYIPVHKSLGLDSADGAFRRHTVHAAIERLEIGGLNLRARTESLAFGRGPNRFVVTLAYPDAKHEPRNRLDYEMTEKQ